MSEILLVVFIESQHGITVRPSQCDPPLAGSDIDVAEDPSPVCFWQYDGMGQA